MTQPNADKLFLVVGGKRPGRLALVRYQTSKRLKSGERVRAYRVTYSKLMHGLTIIEGRKSGRWVSLGRVPRRRGDIASSTITVERFEKDTVEVEPQQMIDLVAELNDLYRNHVGESGGFQNYWRAYQDAIRFWAAVKADREKKAREGHVEDVASKVLQQQTDAGWIVRDPRDIAEEIAATFDESRLASDPRRVEMELSSRYWWDSGDRPNSWTVFDLEAGPVLRWVYPHQAIEEGSDA
jgi:hypothetical protein